MHNFALTSFLGSVGELDFSRFCHTTYSVIVRANQILWFVRLSNVTETYCLRCSWLTSTDNTVCTDIPDDLDVISLQNSSFAIFAKTSQRFKGTLEWPFRAHTFFESVIFTFGNVLLEVNVNYGIGREFDLWWF